MPPAGREAGKKVKALRSKEKSRYFNTLVLLRPRVGAEGKYPVNQNDSSHGRGGRAKREKRKEERKTKKEESYSMAVSRQSY